MKLSYEGKWVLGALVLGAAGATMILVTSGLFYSVNYICETCGSWRWTTHFISYEFDDDMSESALHTDLFARHGHEHEWTFAQSDSWGGCALGAYHRPSEFMRLFDDNAKFRAFVMSKVQGPDASGRDILAELRNRCVHYSEPTPETPVTDGLVAEFKR